MCIFSIDFRFKLLFVNIKFEVRLDLSSYFDFKISEI